MTQLKVYLDTSGVCNCITLGWLCTVRFGCVPHERGLKRGGVLQGEAEVITTTAEQNCGAVLNIDSLIYFNLKHSQTRNVPESVIFSQMPFWSIIHTVKQRCPSASHSHPHTDTKHPPTPPYTPTQSQTHEALTQNFFLFRPQNAPLANNPRT